MADNVRAIMEEMIPELEDMERRGYFNKSEIRQIVKRRTDFEYSLKRRAAVKADYLRCMPSCYDFTGCQHCWKHTFSYTTAVSDSGNSHLRADIFNMRAILMS